MGPQSTAAVSLSELADQHEHDLTDELNTIVTNSVLFRLAKEGHVEMENGAKLRADHPGKFMVMRDDPKLKKMPEKPTLVDFFRMRFFSAQHLLQSARLARLKGLDEKIVMACLLHDIGVVGFIRPDHGYWGEQLIAPYVDEEVSWAIRMHQALRFFPDESVGYTYPDQYIKLFGEHYKPEPYIYAEYERARAHKWYMTSRMITVNDVYAFDPNVKCELEDFIDIIGRNWKQPKEGLGFDNSSSAHMWRTLMWPSRFL